MYHKSIEFYYYSDQTREREENMSKDGRIGIIVDEGVNIERRSVIKRSKSRPSARDSGAKTRIQMDATANISNWDNAGAAEIAIHGAGNAIHLMIRKGRTSESRKPLNISQMHGAVGPRVHDTKRARGRKGECEDGAYLGNAKS